MLIGAGFVTHVSAAIPILTVAVGLSGFQYAGCMVNHVDIAPPFSGILFGLSNTFATLPGILVPYTIRIITVYVSSCFKKDIFNQMMLTLWPDVYAW